MSWKLSMNLLDYELVDDILDNFDFEKVKKVVDAIGWKYYDSEGESCSIAELRKTARKVLTSVVGAREEEKCYVACGGFEAERYMYLGDGKKYVSLKFVVTEMSNY